MPDQMRPDAPDTAVLEQAKHTLLTEHGLSEVESWSVGSRIDRKRSSVFPISCSGPFGTRTVAYYKAMLGPAEDANEAHGSFERTRAGLERTPRLEERLVAQLTADDPLISRAIAVDPPSLTTVTLAVPGDPLGSLWQLTLFPAGRRSARDLMWRLGRLTRLIESCSERETVTDPEDREWRLDKLREGLVSTLGESRTAALSDRLEELRSDVDRDPASMVFAHGDLSSSNVLTGESVGVIDFGWIPRVRTYDLAKLAFRLEYGSALPISGSRSLTHGLIDGYGDQSIQDRAAWNYHRVRMLSKVAASEGPRHAIRRRRAARELTAFL